MSANRILATMVAGCAAVFISAAPAFAAQAAHQVHHPAAAKAKPAAAPAMDAKCQAMMSEHEKMMADMKAADQKLDDLVATMNTASGPEKMAATATVVSEMVAQERTRRDAMMKMQEDMMGHMMEHMQAGKGSMADCPMMKKMANMK
jgi:Skp family chaperone for outer membrane proteins